MCQSAGVLHILTCKRASRYSGAQFFHIRSSKSGPSMSVFWHFELNTCFSLQRRTIFHLSSKQLPPHPRFTKPTFDPADPQIIEKTQHFATFLTFCAIESSFFWLYFSSLLFIFWLHCSALLFQLSILSGVRLLNFLWLYLYSPFSHLLSGYPSS